MNGPNFPAMCPLNGGQPDTYGYPVEYPYDLDASTDYMRPATGVSVFPFPQVLGCVQSLVPLFDRLTLTMMVPGINSVAMNILDNPYQDLVFPNLQGGLRKVTG